MHDIERVVPDEVFQADLEEAQSATAQARRGAEDLWEGLVRMVKCRGWFLLGYKSFRTWAKAELGASLQTGDTMLQKSKILIALEEETGLPIAELEPRVPLRRNRKPSNLTPLTQSMRTAARKLAPVPILTNPTERAAATALRDHLNRLLGG